MDATYPNTSDHFAHHKRVTIIRIWIALKKAKGVKPTAKMIRERISFNWPSVSEADARRVMGDL